jgi:uncharacterized protein YxjI
MHVRDFYVLQRITLLVNRYEINAANPDGSFGELLAFAEQKRFKMKEEVQFFTDDSKSQLAFTFKARQRLDLHAEHDVLDASGQPLGWFKKDFGSSLFRSTWLMAGPGYEAKGQERRPVIAVLRRVWDYIPYLSDFWVPFIFHFDFVDTATGKEAMVSERIKTSRDAYAIRVSDPRIDFRVAASMAVALDAFQGR